MGECDGNYLRLCSLLRQTVYSTPVPPDLRSHSKREYVYVYGRLYVDRGNPHFLLRGQHVRDMQMYAKEEDLEPTYARRPLL